MLNSKGVNVGITDQLVASATNTRAYVGVQNLDAANSVHIALGGQTATALNGIRIGPGEYFDTHAPFNGSEIRGIAIDGAVDIIFVSDN